MKPLLRLALPALAIAACTASPLAHADAYNFSYTLSSGLPGTFITASGTLTTSNTSVGNGAYLITDITGTRTVSFFGQSSTQAIIGIENPDQNYGAADLIYPTGAQYLDSSGFTYSLAGGYGGDDFMGDVNISYYNGNYSEPIELPFDSSTFTLTPVAATPEPSSIALLATGLLGAVGVRRRRSN